MGLLDQFIAPEAAEMYGLNRRADPRSLGGGGLLDNIFATSTDDPRFGANMALAAGLLRRDLGAGLLGYGRAMNDGQDRVMRREQAERAKYKEALEFSDMLRKMKEEQEGRSVLTDFYKNRGLPGRGAQPPAGPEPFGSIEEPMPWATRPGPALPQGSGYGQQSRAPGMPSGGGLGNAMPASMDDAYAFSPGGGGGTSPAAGRTAQYEQYRELAERFAQKGLVAKAQQYNELAEKYRPKFNTTPQIMRGPDNQLYNVLVGEDGSTQVLPFGVKPDVSIEDFGDRKQAIDKNSLAGNERWTKGMTPGERASNAVAQGNLDVSRRRLAFDENTPEYKVTDGGIIALPKRPAPGAPLIGRPVTGPNGEVLGPPLKPIPGGANDAILTNSRALDQIDRAIALMEGKNIGDPAKGGQRGDAAATGWKGYLPEAMLNRFDPEGTDARAEISDIGSLKIHERSGAASSVSEMKRIAPFIPSATDTQEAALKKLRRLRQEVASEQEGLSSTYSREQGYRPNPVSGRPARQPEASASARPLPANPTASNLNVGETYTLPNGRAAKWDGMQFKAVK